MSGVRAVLAPDEEIDPAALSRSFCIGATDYSEVTLVCPLSDRIARDAPGVDLYCSALGGDSPARIRAGDYDLALGVFSDLAQDMNRRSLLHEDFVCLLRRGHPALDRGVLELDTYCELGHVLTAPRGVPRGAVDDALESIGRRRRVARSVTNFMAAPYLVARTDYLLTTPARIAERVAGALDLVASQPPVELRGFEHEMIWHRRDDLDPAHRWLRERIAEAASEPRV